MTEILEYDTYSGVVSSELVYCAFFLAELKGLDVGQQILATHICAVILKRRCMLLLIPNLVLWLVIF
jgi:hypothetical protein